MTDVARLGLEVRSEQVAKGASDLDKLTNAAKRAEAAASGVSALKAGTLAGLPRRCFVALFDDLYI